MFEQALIWYARRFPFSRGKLRVIDALWPLAGGRRGHQRTAALVYGNLRMPCDVRDMLQRQFYFFGTYYLERDLLACWSVLAAEAQVIFDVGANAGIYSLAALAANPQATVHAFEPTPETAERLRVTAELNHLNQLNVQEVAVSDRVGEASLVRCRGDRGNNDGMNYISTMRSGADELVATTSLDQFCLERAIRRIDLLKLDIQGHEAEALAGAKEILGGGCVRTVFVELNWATPGTATCPATRTVGILEEAGFVFAQPTTDALVWSKAGPWLRQMSDVIARTRSEP